VVYYKFGGLLQVFMQPSTQNAKLQVRLCVSHTLQPCLQQVTPYNCLCQSHPTTLPTTSHTLQLPVLVTPYNLAYNKSHPTIACVSHTLQMLTTRAESRIPGKEQRVLCRSNASQ